MKKQINRCLHCIIFEVSFSIYSLLMKTSTRKCSVRKHHSCHSFGGKCVQLQSKCLNQQGQLLCLRETTIPEEDLELPCLSNSSRIWNLSILCEISKLLTAIKKKKNRDIINNTPMAKDHGLEPQEYYGSYHCYVNFSYQMSQWSSIQQTFFFFFFRSTLCQILCYVLQS